MAALQPPFPSSMRAPCAAAVLAALACAGAAGRVGGGVPRSAVMQALDRGGPRCGASGAVAVGPAAAAEGALRLRGGGAAGDGAKLQAAPAAGAPHAGARGAESLSSAHLEAFGTVMKRRFFFGPAFYIHGGFAGLFDYGPTGCAVKKSLIAAWREHFVVQEGMLEIDCPTVTPEPVLAASGHVQRFTDLMVRDESSGDCFRADKLVEEACSAALARLANPAMRAKELQKAAAAGAAAGAASGHPPAVAAVLVSAGDHDAHRTALEQLRDAAGTFDAAGVDAALRALNISSPTTGAPLSAAYPFNLMFRTCIGPTGTLGGFMRPETAQVQHPFAVRN